MSLSKYWLVGHTTVPPKPQGFPDDWKCHAEGGRSAGGCFINGHQTPAAKQTFEQLQGLRLTGTSSSTAQSATLETADNQMFTAKDAGDLLSIGTQWENAEFNIFDLQNSSGANFNSGASMVVRIDVDYAGDVAPDCPIGGGFTAESNNLNPIPLCAGYPGQPNISNPGLQFTEDSIPGIADCSYPALYAAATAAICVPIPESNFADVIFPATCPAGGPRSSS
jgi:hypothetical protein